VTGIFRSGSFCSQWITRQPFCYKKANACLFVGKVGDKKTHFNLDPKAEVSAGLAMVVRLSIRNNAEHSFVVLCLEFVQIFIDAFRLSLDKDRHNRHITWTAADIYGITFYNGGCVLLTVRTKTKEPLTN
jgi:hypothetical protein